MGYRSIIQKQFVIFTLCACSHMAVGRQKNRYLLYPLPLLPNSISRKFQKEPIGTRKTNTGFLITSVALIGVGSAVLIGVRELVWREPTGGRTRPYSGGMIGIGNKKRNFYGYERSLRVFWRLQELNLPNDLPVKDQQHIADHPEHEDLNTNHDEKYR